MNELIYKANVNLICKTISELHFEEILPLKLNNNHGELIISPDIKYEFNYKKSIFNHLIIDTNSLRRNSSHENIYADNFFLEIEFFTKMGGITLSNFIYELNNTIYSDIITLKNKLQTSLDINQRNLDKINEGHPKILLNKGRIGFNIDDLKKFSPEQSDGFQLFWIAIKKGNQKLKIKFKNNYNELKLYDHLSSSEIKRWNKIADQKHYIYIPTHPWQWKNFLGIQFQNEINNENIIPLGFSKRYYQPEISIRTVKDINLELNSEFKLSLNILNTSAYRGISANNIEIGPPISDHLEKIIENDDLLVDSNLSILAEYVSIAFEHSNYSKIENAPYRFQESLGCVLRATCESTLNINETSIMTGSLFTTFNNQQSVIGLIISRSNINPIEWIKLYAKKIVIPLYHLQITYGIGIVSHGQNIILKLENNIPSGMIIKDFQGDLRISNESKLINIDGFNKLKKMPSEHLIHDLITGHFITTLRFISPHLEREKIINEHDFYQTISDEIDNYLKMNHPQLNKESPLSLLRPQFEKIILNKVRFNIGYQDTSERLLPSLGNNIDNPLKKSTIGIYNENL